MSNGKPATLTATYRIVTPMFCSGADQSRAELRLPSFKGALRFWWRSLYGHLSTDELHEEEAKLFGSSGRGQSKVRMRWGDPPREQTSTQKKWSPTQWQAYTGYGLIETTGGEKRDFLQPGSAFSIRLISHNPETLEKHVMPALLAIGLFGGLGGRSRKGWGSLTLEAIEADGEQRWTAPTNVEELRDKINALLSIGTSDQSKQPDHTAFSQGSSFATGPAKQRAEDAHQWISERYKSFVRDLKPKHHREPFGLPRKNGGRNSSKRRSSGVFLHIHQSSHDSFIPVAVMLPARFLENQSLPSGDWDRASQFIEMIGNGTGASQ